MKKTKSKSTKHSSIFIRATEAKELQLIEQLKIETRSKAASQAFLQAGQGYILRGKAIEDLQRELSIVKAQLNNANDVLARLDNASTLLGTYSKKFIKGKNVQSAFDYND